jgi:hypothetical protein
MEPNEDLEPPPGGANPEEVNPDRPWEKQAPPQDPQPGVPPGGGADLVDGVGTLANGAVITADVVDIAGSAAGAVGEVASGAAEVLGSGAEAAGSLLEGAGSCLEGCGSCSLVLLVALFLMAGTALAVFQ